MPAKDREANIFLTDELWLPSWLRSIYGHVTGPVVFIVKDKVLQVYRHVHQLSKPFSCSRYFSIALSVSSSSNLSCNDCKNRSANIDMNM
jgi:hypothetical protein